MAVYKNQECNKLMSEIYPGFWHTFIHHNPAFTYKKTIISWLNPQSVTKARHPDGKWHQVSKQPEGSLPQNTSIFGTKNILQCMTLKAIVTTTFLHHSDKLLANLSPKYVSRDKSCKYKWARKKKTSTGCAYIIYPQSLTLLLYFLSISKNNVSKH